MSDQLQSMDEYMGWAVPVARSAEETMELAFRAADLEDRDERRRAEQQAAARRTDREDLAAVHQFLGHPTRSHAEVLAGAAAAMDQQDQWQAFREQQAERRREAAAEERAAELEEKVATAATRSRRDLQALRQANEAAAAFRQRSEQSEQGASFRGNDEVLTRYRPQHQGEILRIR